MILRKALDLVIVLTYFCVYFWLLKSIPSESVFFAQKREVPLLCIAWNLSLSICKGTFFLVSSYYSHFIWFMSLTIDYTLCTYDCVLLKCYWSFSLQFWLIAAFVFTFLWNFRWFRCSFVWACAIFSSSSLKRIVLSLSSSSFISSHHTEKMHILKFSQQKFLTRNRLEQSCRFASYLICWLRVSCEFYFSHARKADFMTFLPTLTGGASLFSVDWARKSPQLLHLEIHSGVTIKRNNMLSPFKKKCDTNGTDLGKLIDFFSVHLQNTVWNLLETWINLSWMMIKLSCF